MQSLKYEALNLNGKPRGIKSKQEGNRLNFILQDVEILAEFEENYSLAL